MIAKITIIETRLPLGRIHPSITNHEQDAYETGVSEKGTNMPFESRQITNICRKEGIAPSIYYKWSKAFLAAGKRQLSGDTVDVLDFIDIFIGDFLRTNKDYKN